MDENGFGSWKVAVIGAGTMGLCIAQHFAMQGNEVALYWLLPGVRTRRARQQSPRSVVEKELDVRWPLWVKFRPDYSQQRRRVVRSGKSHAARVPPGRAMAQIDGWATVFRGVP